MSHSSCSGTFSSRSRGSCLCSPGPSWGSSYPSNLVLSPDLGSPRPCQRGSSLCRGQRTCWEPPRCRTSCCDPSTPRLCSPCWTTPPGALDCGLSSCSLGCGSRDSRPLGYRVCGLPSQSSGSGFYCPTYSAPRSRQSWCFRRRPSGSGCYW
ncbi:keratin-associated protein 13-1-like [Molossus molossus]|uniref:keratin-associated protein 13-1-like n=1 Tax=Molossus molossus TaxID=27622 RepID=UPI0017460EB8|nr:keratin-associated protein 13-1-like [Molossus molossus]